MKDIKKRIDRLEKETGLNNHISTFSEWIKAESLGKSYILVGSLAMLINGKSYCQNQSGDDL
jgi:hypothetical protein